jgi:adenylate cyclase
MKRNCRVLMTVCFILSCMSVGKTALGKDAPVIDSLKTVLTMPIADTIKLGVLERLYKSTECSDATKSLAYLEQYLKIAEKVNRTKNTGLGQRWLGHVYSYCTENYVKALYWYFRSLAQARQNRDTKEEADLLSEIAYVYARKQDNAKALEYYRESMKILPAKSKEILGNMGTVYNDIGDYPNAAECFEKAYNIQNRELIEKRTHSTNDTLNLIGLLISLSDVEVSMAQYEKALENYKRSELLNRDIKNKSISLWVQTGMGKCLEYQKDYSGAIKRYESALNISRQIASDDYESDLLNKIGNVYLENGDLNLSSEYAKKALSISGEKQNKYLPGSYLLSGKLYSKKKNYSLAVSYLQKAISLYNKSGQVDEESNAWYALSNTYELMNKKGAAFDAYKNHVVLRDSVFSLKKASQMTRIELQGEFDRKLVSDSLAQARKDVVMRLHIQKQRGLIYGSLIGLGLVLLLSFFVLRNNSIQKKANIAITKANTALLAEKHISEKLLLNILPADVAEELKAYGKVKAKLFDNVTVLMTDFVGFTMAGEQLSPESLVAELHTCFEAFDNIVGRHKLEKIKTIGDAYMAACGLPMADEKHAENVINAALEIASFMTERKKKTGVHTFAIRIGIHSGSVVAGIVGVKKFAYDIWGDTVNTAARMEQNSEAGKVNISHTTYELVKDKFSCEYRGEVDVKGKGVMKMYFVS